MIARENSGNSEYKHKNTLETQYGCGQSMVTNVICVQTRASSTGYV